MPDQNQNQPQSFPVVQPATRFALLVAPTDIALYLGVARMGFDPIGRGVAQVVEYGAGFALSPTAAAQLRDALTQAIGQYEGQFGKIPLAPDAVQQFEVAPPAPSGKA